MNSNSTFRHSIPVPRIYKIASKIAKNVKEGRDSLKNLVYKEKHVNIKSVYALIVETFKREDTINGLISKSQLLVQEPRFDNWLAKILICEMLWGKNKMTGDSRPVQTILQYENILRELLSNCEETSKNVLNYVNINKPRYVRVNTLKITVEDAVNNFREDGWTLVPFLDKSNYGGFLEKVNELKDNEFMVDIHVKDLLIFPPKTEFHKHDAYKSRYIILQDKASCLPVQLLNPSPGSTIIDMCAAPGMKTTQLAAAVNDTGIVYAVEMDRRREKVLREFVESAGAKCVKTILNDVMQVTGEEFPDIEYILVDPSCSGSGITDRVEVEDQSLSNKMQRLRKLCSFQAKLLRHATTSFPNVKRIVYSTCSINSEENEDVVRQVLETCKNFKLVDAKKLLPCWNDTSSEVFPEFGKMCIYATPENDKTNGFFIAVLEKLQSNERNPHLNVQLCKMFEKKAKEKRKSQENFNYNSQMGNIEDKILKEDGYFEDAEVSERRHFKKENKYEKVSNDNNNLKKQKNFKTEINQIEDEMMYNKIKIEKTYDLEEIKGKSDIGLEYLKKEKYEKVKIEPKSESMLESSNVTNLAELSKNYNDNEELKGIKKRRKNIIDDNFESKKKESDKEINIHKSKKKIEDGVQDDISKQCDPEEIKKVKKSKKNKCKDKFDTDENSFEMGGINSHKIQENIKMEMTNDVPEQKKERNSGIMDNDDVSQSKIKKHKKKKCKIEIEDEKMENRIDTEDHETTALENNENIKKSKKNKRIKESEEDNLSKLEFNVSEKKKKKRLKNDDSHDDTKLEEEVVENLTFEKRKNKKKTI